MKDLPKPLMYEGVYNKNKDDCWYYGIVTKIIDDGLEVSTLDGKKFLVDVGDILPSGKFYWRE
jgi:hypothetical protein